jgi:hypothetical protein
MWGPVEPTDATEPRAVTTQVGRARGDEPRRSCPKGRAASPMLPGNPPPARTDLKAKYSDPAAYARALAT